MAFQQRPSYGAPSGVGMAPSAAGPAIRMDPATQARAAELRKEFAELDADKNGFITVQEVSEFLKKKSGDAAEMQQMVLEIFRRLDKNQDQRISVEEFVIGYADAESELQKLIERTEQDIQEKERQKATAIQQLKEAQGTERVNARGIMEKSQLTVTVHEAQDLAAADLNGKSDPYCILMCEKQQIETKVVWNDLNPVWNEAFTFNIVEGNKDLNVRVMDKDRVGHDDFLGLISVPLSDLRDQMKHESWFQLQAEEPGKKAQGRIKLSLQWIHSRVAYLETVVKQWEENIAQSRRDLQELKDQLDKLKAPFGLLTFNRLFGYEKRVSDMIGQIAVTHLKITNWTLFCNALLVAYFVLVTFGMYARPDFLNMLIAAYGFYNMSGNKWSKDAFMWILIAMGSSMVYDIIWMSIYVSQWAKTGSGMWDPTEGSTPEDGVKRFANFCSIVTFLLKLVILIVLYKNFVDVRAGRKQPLPTTTAPAPSMGMGRVSPSAAGRVSATGYDMRPIAGMGTR